MLNFQDLCSSWKVWQTLLPWRSPALVWKTPTFVCKLPAFRLQTFDAANRHAAVGFLKKLLLNQFMGSYKLCSCVNSREFSYHSYIAVENGNHRREFCRSADGRWCRFVGWLGLTWCVTAHLCADRPDLASPAMVCVGLIRSGWSWLVVLGRIASWAQSGTFDRDLYQRQFRMFCPVCFNIETVRSILFYSVLFCSVLVCSGLVCPVLVCSRLFWSVLIWSGQIWSGLVWSGLAWSGLVWSVLVCSGLFWSVLVGSVLVWSLLVCSVLAWSVPF